MSKCNDSIRQNFLLLLHWSNFWIIGEAASSGYKEKVVVNISSVYFFLFLNMTSNLGDVITNCSEYLWQHKHTNVIDRNVVNLVPETQISLSNNFLSYFFKFGKGNALQWLYTSNNNNNQWCLIWIFSSPFTCYAAACILLNEKSNKKAAFFHRVFIVIYCNAFKMLEQKAEKLHFKVGQASFLLFNNIFRWYQITMYVNLLLLR